MTLPRRQEHALKVDVQTFVPLRFINVGDATGGADAGIVEQEVYASEVADSGIRHGADTGIDAHVGLHGLRCAATLNNAGGRLPDAVESSTGANHAGAGRGESDGAGRPDAGAGACNNGNLALQGHSRQSSNQPPSTGTTVPVR